MTTEEIEKLIKEALSTPGETDEFLFKKIKASLESQGKWDPGNRAQNSESY